MKLGVIDGDLFIVNIFIQAVLKNLVKKKIPHSQT